MLPDNCTVVPQERQSVIKPYCMSHGTLEVYSLKDSRRFYEEFLGLECVRHGKPAMVIRLGMRFHVVCVEVGDQIHPCSLLNHWGVDVATRAEVDEAHAKAVAHKDKFKIRQVLPVQEMHAVFPSPKLLPDKVKRWCDFLAPRFDADWWTH